MKQNAFVLLWLLGICTTASGQAPAKLPIFDPRIDAFEIPMPPEGEDVVSGDYRLGSVKEVLRHSWITAVTTAKAAREGNDLNQFQQLTADEKDAIRTLSTQQLNLPDNQVQALLQVRKAIEALRPLFAPLARDLPAEAQTRRNAAILARTAILRVHLWNGKKIHFTVDETLPPGTRDKIDEAVQEWNRELSDCLELKEYNIHKHGPVSEIVVFRLGDACGTKGLPGKIPKERVKEVFLTEDCGKAQVLHEMGHVAGLFHEHQRHDRHEYFIVNNPQGDDFKVFKEVFDLGPFDFKSIMLYPAVHLTGLQLKPGVSAPADFGIKTKDGGSTVSLSKGDIAAIRSMYK